MKERVKVFDEKMTKAYNHLLSEYQTIRAGRANPHVLDKIRVDYYGTPTPIQQVGNVSVPDPRSILIQPWDASILKEVEKVDTTAMTALSSMADDETLAVGEYTISNESNFDYLFSSNSTTNNDATK